MDDELHEIMLMQLDARERRTTKALERVRTFRQLKAKPLVTYRCHDGDLLLEAWSTPDGILWHAPSVRISPDRQRDVPGQFIRHAAEGRVRDDGGVVSGERAGVLEDDRPVQMLCRHHADKSVLPSATLRADVERAQTTGTPLRMRLA